MIQIELWILQHGLQLTMLQQFAFKPATNKNIKPIAGLRPATFLVAGLLEHGCKRFFESPKLVQIRAEAGVKSSDFIYLEQIESGTL